MEHRRVKFFALRRPFMVSNRQVDFGTRSFIPHLNPLLSLASNLIPLCMSMPEMVFASLSLSSSTISPLLLLPQLLFTKLLRFLSLRRNITYLGSPKLGRLYRYLKSLPTFCFPHISSSTSSSTYFATSLYHTKFALSNGAKSLICYIGK